MRASRLGWIGLLVAQAFAPTLVRALPFYQLDAEGGSYDSLTETVVTSETSFTLYAYAYPKSAAERSDVVSGPSYLSIAIAPAQGPSNVDLGSFTLGGELIRVSADLVYGIPPLEAGGATHDGGDLGSHDVFETFFVQREFRFSLADQSAPYDTALAAGSGPRTGTGMLVAAFEIDTSGLAPGVSLHFDLFSTRQKKGDTDILRFAPFSHDAATLPAPDHPLPEPGTSALLLCALAALPFGARARTLRGD